MLKSVNMALVSPLKSVGQGTLCKKAISTNLPLANQATQLVNELKTQSLTNEGLITYKS